MDYVQLGETGLVSSVIGLGGGSSGQFGLAKGGTRSDALRLIQMAIDEGITFFDGSGICGSVDEVLADGLGARRNDVLISTKVHLGPEPLFFTTSSFANKASSWRARRRGLVTTGAVIRARVERALRALRTDRIDVLHLHAVSGRQYPLVVGRILPELQKLKDEGKVRVIGLTEEFLKDPSHEMLRAAVADKCVDTIMVGFNLRNPTAGETVIPAAKRGGMGTIGMFAARGLLSHAAQDPSKLEDLLRDAGVPSLAALAYRYSRHQAGVDVVLTGTSNPAHLQQNIASALAPKLPASLVERCAGLLS